MNIILNNVINNFENFKTLISKISDKENYSSSEEFKDLSTFNRDKITKELSELRSDALFEKSNIVASLGFVKIENKEDFNKVKEVVNYLVDLTSFPLEINEKSELAKNLLNNADKSVRKDVIEWTSAFNDKTDVNENIVNYYKYNLKEKLFEELHENFKTKKESEFVNKFFGEFYNKVNYFKMYEGEDKGKSALKEFLSDKQIPRTYKKQMKEAYQTYQIENKVGVKFAGLGALATGIPLSLVLGTGVLVGSTLKFVGNSVEKMFNFISSPFLKISEHFYNKGNAKLSNLFLVPKIILDLPGIVVSTITDLVGSGVITVANLLTYPLKQVFFEIATLVNGDSKYNYDLNIKMIKKNLANQLKEDGINISARNVLLADKTVKDGKVSIRGFVKNSRQGFEYSYAISDNLESRINNKNIFVSELAEDDKEEKDFYETARILANVSTQQPVDRKIKEFDSFEYALSELIMGALENIKKSQKSNENENDEIDNEDDEIDLD